MLNNVFNMFSISFERLNLALADILLFPQSVGLFYTLCKHFV